LFIKFKTGNNRHHNQLSDETLVNRYKHKKENSSIEELFNLYTHLIYGVCLKYLKDREQAKDAVMEIFRSIDLVIDKEIVRVIQSSSPWIPGKQCGRKVNVSFSLPIIFQQK